MGRQRLSLHHPARCMVLACCNTLLRLASALQVPLERPLKNPTLGKSNTGPAALLERNGKQGSPCGIAQKPARHLLSPPPPPPLPPADAHPAADSRGIAAAAAPAPGHTSTLAQQPANQAHC